MSEYIHKQKLLDFMKNGLVHPESQIVRAIESGMFDSKTDYKAITELAVKGLEEIIFKTKMSHWEQRETHKIAKTTLSEIERLQNGTLS